MNNFVTAPRSLAGYFFAQSIRISINRCIRAFLAASILMFAGNAFAVITVGLAIENDTDSNGNITVIDGGTVKVAYEVIEDTDKDLHKKDKIQLLRVSDDSVVDSVLRGKKKSGSVSLKAKNSEGEQLYVHYIRKSGTLIATASDQVTIIAKASLADLTVELNATEKSLENRLVGRMIGVGPITNVDISILNANDWTECWSETYATTGTPIANVLAACNKSNLMMACRLTGDPNIIVAASAPVAEVTTNTTTDSTTTNPSNGVEWYYHESKSWGFALGGSAVSKGTCDTRDDNDQFRLCTHTGSGAINSGYKCGTVEGLNSSTAYELVFLHKDYL
jgi:hypothetical protein